MSKQRNQLPSGAGGLVRYFDEFDDQFAIDPLILVGGIGFFILILLFLQMANPLSVPF